MAHVQVVARDPGLTERVRAALAGEPGLALVAEGGAPDLVLVEAALLDQAEGQALLAAGAADQSGLGWAAGPRPPLLALVPEGNEAALLEALARGADDALVLTPGAGQLRRRALEWLEGGAERAPTTEPTEPAGAGPVRPEVEDLAALARELETYEVLGVLGRGGYGVVYRARHRERGEEVALKLLPAGLAPGADGMARFRRESEAVARLDHPEIVGFRELGCCGGRCFYTMELVEGETLEAIGQREGPLPVARAARYAAGVARALGALHSLGLVHRDVKPQNVLVTAGDRVKLIDFGLVRMQDSASITAEDAILGTPHFMVPEGIRAGREPDIRYDLYSLGVTLFWLLTGEYPFDGPTTAHVIEQHLRRPAPPVRALRPDAPAGLEELLLALLEKDPDRRPATPAALLARLEPFLG